MIGFFPGLIAGMAGGAIAHATCDAPKKRTITGATIGGIGGVTLSVLTGNPVDALTNGAVGALTGGIIGHMEFKKA